MDSRAKSFAIGFLVSLILCWSPVKALGYAAPVAFLVIMLIGTRFRTDLCRRLAVMTLCWVALVAVRGLFQSSFVIQNALLSFGTYGAFVAAFAVPQRYLRSRKLQRLIIGWLTAMVVLQSTLGVFQAGYGYTQTGSFDIANGDFVEGTIHPDWSTGRDHSNPLFAVNLAMALLALWAVGSHLRWRLPVLALGCLAFVLASVVHVLLFAATAVLVAALLFGLPGSRRSGRSLGRRIATGAVLLAVPVVAALVLSTNIGTLADYGRLTLEGRNPKFLAAERLLQLGLEEPSVLLVGYGPGQAVSRAALISSGHYLGGFFTPRELGPLSATEPPAFMDIVWDLWRDVSSMDVSAGSTRVPFSSILAIWSEFGILGLTLLACGSVWFTLSLRRAVLLGGDRSAAFALASSAGLIVLLGFQELYWEVPQAIFVGLLTCKVLDANLIGVEARD